MKWCFESTVTDLHRTIVLPPVSSVSRIVQLGPGSRHLSVVELESLPDTMDLIDQNPGSARCGWGAVLRTRPYQQSKISAWAIVNQSLTRRVSIRKRCESVRSPLGNSAIVRASCIRPPPPCPAAGTPAATRRHLFSCAVAGTEMIFGFPTCRRTILRASEPQSFEPQNLQCTASPSCPSAPHSGQAWVLTFLPLATPASSTDTIPVGTAMMP
jgi:hypothetical protein